jgi:hypothetical protein
MMLSHSTASFMIALVAVVCTGCPSIRQEPLSFDGQQQEVKTDGGDQAETFADSIDAVYDANDGIIDVGDASSTFCGSQAKPAGSSDWLCDDFDDAPTLQGFSDITNSVFPAGALYTPPTSLLTNLYFHSAPYSASLSSPSGYWWSATDTPAISDVRLSFYMNIGQFDPAASTADLLQLAAIEFEGGAIAVALVIQPDSVDGNLEFKAKWSAYDFPSIDTDYESLPTPTKEKWIHVEIECNPIVGTFAIYFDGVNQYVNGRHVLGCMVPAATANVFTGMAGTWNGILIRFDDVTSTIWR